MAEPVAAYLDEDRAARASTGDSQLYDSELYAAERARRRLRDFIPFIWPVIEPQTPYLSNWSTDAVCEHLQAVYDGEIRDLLIMEPPRCMKSITLCVAFPAWCWVKDPTMRFIFGSYAQPLASRDSVRCRYVLDSQLYGRHFRQGPEPPAWEMQADQNEKGKFENTLTGVRFSTHVAGGTGEGGDCLVVDDPHNVSKIEEDIDRKRAVDWWHGTMSTRHNNPKTGTRVVSGQRTHETDLAGTIMERMQRLEDYPDYEILMLPMEFDSKRRCSTSIGFVDPREKDGELLWPSRFGEREVARLKSQLGPRIAAAQLAQEPAPAGGDIFKREWFSIVDEAPPKALWEKDVRGWDLGATEGGGDPTASGRVVYAKDGYWYILDCSYFHKGPGGVEDAIKAQASQDGRGTIVGIEREPGASGPIVVANFAKILPKYTVIACPAQDSKWNRAYTLASKAENRLVRLVRGGWNDEWLHAAETFGPGGANLHIMDGTVHAFNATLEDDEGGDGFSGVISA